MCFDLQNAWAWGQCPKEWKSGGWAPCVIMVIAVTIPQWLMAENFCHPSWLHKMRAHSGLINMETTAIACNNTACKHLNSMDMDGILSIKLEHMIAGMFFFLKAISSPPAGNKTSLQLNPLCDQSMASFHKLYWALDHV